MLNGNREVPGNPQPANSSGSGLIQQLLVLTSQIPQNHATSTEGDPLAKQSCPHLYYKAVSVCGSVHIHAHMILPVRYHVTIFKGYRTILHSYILGLGIEKNMVFYVLNQ